MCEEQAGAPANVSKARHVWRGGHDKGIDQGFGPSHEAEDMERGKRGSHTCFKLSAQRLTQDLWRGFGQDKGIDQAFWPIFELEDMEEGKRGSHWLTRVALAAGLAASVWALHVYAPDRTRLKGASATVLDPAFHSSCVGAACPCARSRTSGTPPQSPPAIIVLSAMLSAYDAIGVGAVRLPIHQDC